MADTSDIQIIVNPMDVTVDDNINSEPPVVEHSPSYGEFIESTEICTQQECVPCDFNSEKSRLESNYVELHDGDELITPAEPITSLDRDDINIEDVSKSTYVVKATNVSSVNTIPFHKMPSTIKSPSANYYCPISWTNFEQWQLVRFSTPMDNHCLFHSISNSFFAPYHDEMLNGKRMTRKQMVSHVRRELSKKLAAKIDPSDPNSPRYYDVLNGGNTAVFAEAVPEFKLEFMQDQLNSQVPIGYGYMEFIGDALNKDIYILEAARRDIYKTDELRLTIKGNRRSIILYYMNGHYELVGIHNPDGTFDTHFAPDHSLIRFLNYRVQVLIQERQA